MKNFTLLLLWASTLPLFAQENLRTLRGNVTDQDGDALIGATIRLINGSGGTMTDVNGNFVLKLNDSSNGEIEVSYMGYKKQKIAYNTANLGKLKVALKSSIEELPTVTITAMRQDYRCFCCTCCLFYSAVDKDKPSIRLDKPGSLHLWPNPTVSLINMELPLDVTTDIYIFDVTGRLVHREQTQLAGTHAVSVANWTSGAYVVLLSNVHGQVSAQFVVAR